MSSSRYQSKLFNFVYQQSQRLTEQWESTVRSLQDATIRSVEALLYPLYKLFQPDEWEGKRLQAAANPPATDAAIQQVLEEVQNLPCAAVTPSQTDLSVSPFVWFGQLWEKFVHKPPQALPPEGKLQYHIPEVRAIACQVSKRDLVLVTPDNRILDVLNPQQQAKLTDKINQEVAEYWYLVKLAGLNAQKVPQLPTTSLPQPPKVVGFLDHFLANLEVKTIIPIQQRGQEIIHQTQTQLYILLSGKNQPVTRGQNNAEDLENQQPSISELIEAAINYFFGTQPRQQILKDFTPENIRRNILPENQQFPERNLLNSSNDSWLTWDDLFGNMEINQNPVSTISSVEKFQPTPAQDNLPKPQAREVLGWTRRFTNSAKSNQSTSKENSRSSQAEFYQQFTPQLEAEQDWIDTSAKFLGYEKHPLEQVLEWLDLAMAWIEQMFLNLVYFCRGLLLGK
ncbi:MAG TPA: hypothetical protein VK184_07270 [Nostocaceae cyanobacterium]|nr:hypothetical protein [Nostocaceae cyanobacterium]